MLSPVLFSNSSEYSRTLPYIIKGPFPDYDIDEEKSLNNWSLQCSNSVKGANFIISTVVSLKGKTIIQYDYFQNTKLKFKNLSNTKGASYGKLFIPTENFDGKKCCGGFHQGIPLQSIKLIQYCF